MFKNKIAVIVVIVVLVAAIFTAITLTSTPKQVGVGGTTNFDTIGVTGLYIGSSGTTLTGVFTGSCSILANASVAATSTSNFDCVASNAVSGDKVFSAQAASSTLASQFVIKAVQASTTSGFTRPRSNGENEFAPAAAVDKPKTSKACRKSISASCQLRGKNRLSTPNYRRGKCGAVTSTITPVCWNPME